MSSVTRQAVDKIIAIIEAVTPDTPGFSAARSFRHHETSYDASHTASVQSPSRRFMLMPTGSRQLIGAMGATGSPIEVVQTWELSITYEQPTSAIEMFRVIAEDIDRIAWSVSNPISWGDAPIIMVDVGDYSIDPTRSGSDGICIVTVPIDIRYRPSFAG